MVSVRPPLLVRRDGGETHPLSSLPVGVYCGVDRCLLAPRGCVAFSCLCGDGYVSRRSQPRDAEACDVVLGADARVTCAEDGLGCCLVELRYVICSVKLPAEGELTEERVECFFDRAALADAQQIF